MCAMTELSRAGYYRRFKAVAPDREEAALRDRIQQLVLAHRHYGYRRITALLRRDGWLVNHKRVNRLMREDNLLCLKRKAFMPATTDSKHRFRVYPNLARKLQPTAVNQLWVADITYVRLATSFAYLAVILDVHSRRVIGHAMATHLKASLALDALDKALASRPVTPGSLVHHSDRGVQYASSDYIARLDAHGIEPSMSRIGCPYDNAFAESFMKTLKTEQVDGQTYQDLAHAEADINGFIDQVYNRHRLHSALAYRSPEEFEASEHNLPHWPPAAPQQPANAATTCP